jgi:hypothetical protein
MMEVMKFHSSNTVGNIRKDDTELPKEFDLEPTIGISSVPKIISLEITKESLAKAYFMIISIHKIEIVFAETKQFLIKPNSRSIFIDSQNHEELFMEKVQVLRNI